jgi:hypothetical protein
LGQRLAIGKTRWELAKVNESDWITVLHTATHTTDGFTVNGAKSSTCSRQKGRSYISIPPYIHILLPKPKINQIMYCTFKRPFLTLFNVTQVHTHPTRLRLSPLLPFPLLLLLRLLLRLLLGSVSFGDLVRFLVEP